jgi:hypothetical protein
MSGPHPNFSRGQYVRPVGTGPNGRGAPSWGWRAITAPELDAWQKNLHESIRDGRLEPHDSGGESWLPPRQVGISLQADRVYEVIRARCSPYYEYQKMPHSCLVRCLLTGEELYIERRLLQAA